MKKHLDNKLILVTGAQGRIGRTISSLVEREGGTVVMFDIGDHQPETLDGHYFQVDCTSADEFNRAVSTVVKRFGRIDAALHAAYPRSEGWGTPFGDLQQNFVSEDMQNQLGASIMVSQILLAQFVKQGFGNLIHISSIQGIAAPKFSHYEGTDMVSPIEYSAIKSGIINLTRYLAKFHRGANIRVNCISPGGISADQPVDFIERYGAECNGKGLLAPEDIDGTALYLLSDMSACVTGQNLIVDDGWSL